MWRHIVFVVAKRLQLLLDQFRFNIDGTKKKTIGKKIANRFEVLSAFLCDFTLAEPISMNENSFCFVFSFSKCVYDQHKQQPQQQQQ